MKVMVDIDGSEDSSRAYEYAMNIYLNEEDEIQIVVIAKVVPSNGSYFFEASNATAREEAQKLKKEYEAMVDAHPCLQRLKKKPTIMVVEGTDPRKTFLELADKVHPDLTVVGRHSFASTRRASRKLSSGSFSNYVPERTPYEVHIVD
eukprot:EC123099.1.p1 GENE.EC123099.1~~EC123099.1.p1  ORF type:complete len:148 (+),score=33.50 EC123099.1:118-561(+)